MSGVKVVNKLPVFSLKLAYVLDNAIAETAKDILIQAKTRAPFKKGGLRRESVVNQVMPLKWRVTFWQEYAAFQEAGGSSRRTVRQYTTPGTGAHFLERSGNEKKKTLQGNVAKHTRRII